MSSRCSRSERSRSIPPIRRTSGWAPVRAGRATACRSAMASTTPPPPVRPGRTSACPTPSASPGSSSTRARPTPSMPACPASCGATRPSAVCTRPPTAAVPGSCCSRAPISRPAAAASRSTHALRTCCSPACGTSGARAGRSAPGGTGRPPSPAAACIAARMAAGAGAKSPRRPIRASPPNLTAASRSPWRRAIPRGCTPSSSRPTRRC